MSGKTGIPEEIQSLILDREQAHTRVLAWKQGGERVVFTNGCFDILHAGHIYLLYEAASLGTRMVIGLNTDESVSRLKGEGRPVRKLAERAAILAALKPVDLVVPFAENTPLELISLLKPDVLVKGGDYRISEVVGAEMVQSYGGVVRIIPLLPGYSTTSFLKDLS